MHLDVLDVHRLAHACSTEPDRVLASDQVDLQSHMLAISTVHQIHILTWHLVYLPSVLSKVGILVDEALVAFEVHLRDPAG